MADVVPSKVGFPTACRVRPGVRGITFPLTGRPPQGYWNEVLAFGAEVVRPRPATVVTETHLAEGVPALRPEDVAATPGVIRRRAFHLEAVESGPFPQPVLWSQDVLISVLTGPTDPGLRFRHAEAHAVVFVHRGEGTLATDFGPLAFSAGQFLFLPKGVTYSLRSRGPVVMLFYEFPKRVLRPFHYWIRNYPYPDTALTPPEPAPVEDEPSDRGDFPVYVKRLVGPWTVLRYPFSPFDTVAWEANLYPFRLSLKDIRTLSSPDFHLDPPTYTVFVTEDEGASMQAFLPRWVHSLPYPHNNDVDEVLFNHSGYHARPEVKDGYATLHPAGTFHGPDVRLGHQQSQSPQPPGKDIPWREETGVMVESRSPFLVLPAAERVEVPGYDQSWLRQYQAVAQV
jgi:homogentisate 1,2-dioxygenase